jgi:hypothetical protein
MMPSSLQEKRRETVSSAGTATFRLRQKTDPVADPTSFLIYTHSSPAGAPLRRIGVRTTSAGYSGLAPGALRPPLHANHL